MQGIVQTVDWAWSPTTSALSSQYLRVSVSADSATVPKTFRSLSRDRLVGLVVEAFASRAEDPRFESRLSRNFFGVESYQ